MSNPLHLLLEMLRRIVAVAADIVKKWHVIKVFAF
jgi:hypothetical protein